MPQGKGIYQERSETTERVLADAKEKHGLGFTTLRDKAKVTMQVLLIFACMNLKKLAVWKSRDPRLKPEPGLSFLFFPLFVPDPKFVTRSVVWVLNPDSALSTSWKAPFRGLLF